MGQIRGSSPLGERISSRIILQLFRNGFATSGWDRCMLQGQQGIAKRRSMEDIMSAKAVIRMPGEGKEVTLAGKPLVFLVTGQDTKHTSMFDWTLPAGF